MTLTHTRRGLTAIAGIAAIALAITGCSVSPEPDPEAAETEAPAEGWTVEFNQAAADLLPAEVAEAGKILVGGEDGRAPFRFVEDGELTGIEVDIMEAIGDVLGLEIQYENISGLAPTLLALSSERVDVAFGPFRPNPDRQREFDYVNFMIDGNGYLTLADDDRIQTTPDDICGLTIAYLESSNAADYLAGVTEKCVAAGEEPVDGQGVSSNESMMLGVLSARYDAATTASPLGRYAASQNEELRWIEDPDRGTATLGSLTSKLRPEMGAALFAAYEQLFEQGVLAKIMAKWGQEDAMTDEPTRLD